MVVSLMPVLLLLRLLLALPTRVELPLPYCCLPCKTRRSCIDSLQKRVAAALRAAALRGAYPFPAFCFCCSYVYLLNHIDRTSAMSSHTH